MTVITRTPTPPAPPAAPRRAPTPTRRQVDAARVEKRRAEVLTLAEQGTSTAAIAAHFGLARGTIAHDIAASLDQYRQERLAMSELVFDDHLRQLDTLILQLTPHLFQTPSTTKNGQRQPITDADGSPAAPVPNTPVIAQWQTLMQERARLLGLYPKAEEQEAKTQNNFYISFTGGPPELDADDDDRVTADAPLGIIPGYTTPSRLPHHAAADGNETPPPDADADRDADDD